MEAAVATRRPSGVNPAANRSNPSSRKNANHAARAIDDLGRAVPARGDQIFPIRAEGDVVDVEIVPDPVELLAGRRIPGPDS